MRKPPAEQGLDDAPLAASGFFALRTPLLPFQVLRDWPAGEGDCSPTLLRERLQTQVRQPHVEQALFVASPSLSESLPHWMDGADDKRAVKVENSLVRYFERMASRPTPFGLFSGLSLGLVGQQTRLELAPREDYQTHSRLDMDYLYLLCEDLSRAPELRRKLRFRPNSSLYTVAGRLRYAEARQTAGERSYHLVAVEPTPYLEATLSRAARGALPTELAQALAREEDVSLEEAQAFIDELIDTQLLVSGLSPPVTGREPIHGIVEILKAIPEAADRAGALERVRDQLLDIDRLGLAAPVEAYLGVARTLEPLGTKVELSRLVQVDVIKPAEGLSLSSRVVADAEAAVRLFQRMARKPAEDALSAFRKAFTDRFEQREVPLVEALDEESGIGFDRNNGPSSEDSPLLLGLGFPGPEEHPGSSDPRQAWLLRRVQEAVGAGVPEITLTSEDVERLSARDPDRLPDAFSVMFTIAAASAEAVDRGEYRLWWQGGNGPSGARVLGRFCNADAELRRCVCEHLSAEAQLVPDAAFVEIVHLPNGRIGNVICRPHLRDYELAYLGTSEAPEERQIPITDLLVSVHGDRVVLRSRRLQREVLPRLTTAHNYGARTNLNVYRFLCALQTQGVATGLSWSWAGLESAPFLPRVSYGRLVLSPARWRMDKDFLESLATESGAQAAAKLRAWARERRVPRFVALVDRDQELPVDFENSASLRTFSQLVGRRPWCVLAEMPHLDSELCVEGPEGKFTHEIVLPFVRKPEPAKPRTERRLTGTTGAAPGVRSFVPGSDWLFFKVYCGSVDRVLARVVAPLCERLALACDRWFFLRYGDPEWHLRLRFHGPPELLNREVAKPLKEALEPLLGDGTAWRVQADTYVRELERYGGPVGVELAERVFCADSQAVLRIISSLDGEDASNVRWKLALRGIDMLLSDLRLDAREKLELARMMRAQYGQEFRADESELKHQMGRKYRELRKDIEQLMELSADEDSALQPGLQALVGRSQALSPVVADLYQAASAGQLGVSVAQLAGSYAHMFANRLFRSAGRAQELVVYDLLVRTYESRRARIANRSGGT